MATRKELRRRLFSSLERVSKSNLDDALGLDVINVRERNRIAKRHKGGVW